MWLWTQTTCALSSCDTIFVCRAHACVHYHQHIPVNSSAWMSVFAPHMCPTCSIWTDRQRQNTHLDCEWTSSPRHLKNGCSVCSGCVIIASPRCLEVVECQASPGIIGIHIEWGPSFLHATSHQPSSGVPWSNASSSGLIDRISSYYSRLETVVMLVSYCKHIKVHFCHQTSWRISSQARHWDVLDIISTKAQLPAHQHKCTLDVEACHTLAAYIMCTVQARHWSSKSCYRLKQAPQHVSLNMAEKYNAAPPIPPESSIQ